ncbi:MAG: hypothetical protein JXA45_00710 [Methanomassiliicoccales archaeon]|nr:hypothetical protein [Methanomassiliicoccales archaeon]
MNEKNITDTSICEMILSFLLSRGGLSGILLENRNLIPPNQKMIKGMIRIQAFQIPMSNAGVNDMMITSPMITSKFCGNISMESLK